MEFQLRAEYAEGTTPPRSGEARDTTWHMTEAGEARALCGRDLDPASETRPAEAWGTEAAEPFCRSCGAQYLRQGQ
ncbi:hypothetical protein ACFV2Z_38900 [Streptomyces sp. NPDC059688]|uniref:Uncharacterized protein n=1 Tax=Streptomyces sp. 900105245 TaxID=3154379 RepID=A0ABV1UJV8_9ACTN|nr:MULTISPECIES: hypothetical protein [unclassified Streptomyces]OKJ80843.1 hypothetical protein AMK32_24190 [Streptomyces sp. CB01883]ROP55625.1 hypothetical protein EDD94_5185 [Streptomyces sp. PanSC9]